MQLERFVEDLDLGRTLGNPVREREPPPRPEDREELGRELALRCHAAEDVGPRRSANAATDQAKLQMLVRLHPSAWEVRELREAGPLN